MLKVENISAGFGDSDVLHDISFEVDEGQILCLLGASGCGKTTLLRIIAGLETPRSGDIQVNGQSILSIPVHERGFGLMFQDYALFPHMSVKENVAFGLQMNRQTRQNIRLKVQQTLELVGLVGFESRSVTELSGGEQQRVALARSLAPEPPLLMLDEPLGSLDAALRDKLVVELKTILKKARVTAVYVTHDQQEAFAIADCVAVMNAGQIEQNSPPQDIYRNPATPFVARFLGLQNILDVTDWQSGDGEIVAYTAIGDFKLPRYGDGARGLNFWFTTDKIPGKLLLHPAYAHIVESPDGIPVTVEKRTFRGMYYALQLNHPDLTFPLMIQIATRTGSNPAPGDSIRIAFQPEGIIPLYNRFYRE